MLIAMAVYDTVENKRTEQTRQTLESLYDTVDFTKHRLIISDNGSCEATQELYREARKIFNFGLILNGENLGTAVAVNKAWKLRVPGEHVLKMDNDVTINHPCWADEMEEVFARASYIGIVGLKRTDLLQHPDSDNQLYASQLLMLPHKSGERWVVVEEAADIMGTCTAFSSELIEKLGGLYQMQDEGNLYGFDDVLACVRTHVLGFKTVFLPHIPICHIDPGGTVYTEEKSKTAGRWMDRFNQVKDEYRTGNRPLYWEDK